MKLAGRKVALLALGFVLILLVVGMPSWGQDAVEPSGEIAEADCYGHHKTEGFRSLDLFPQAVTQVPKASKFDFQLTLTNPWLHELQNVQGYVNISGAPGLEFPGAKAPDNVTKDITINAQPVAPTGPPTGVPMQAGTASLTLPVEANATDMIVSVVAVAGSTAPAVQQKSDVELTVESPDGQAKIKDGTQKPPTTPGVSPGRQTQTVEVDTTNLTRAGPGAWKATLKYNGIAPTASYKLTAVVYYNLSQSRELVVNGPALLKPGEKHTFTFSIVTRDVAALQSMRYGGRANAHHLHTDKSIGDDGTYDKWNTFSFETGTQLIVGNADVSAQGGSVNLLEPVFRRWGQVLGLAGSFLILPSLVFGGTFGRKSVDWSNTLFGGARRRVLFHNSLSFWLLGIAVVHMFLFFYEAFWDWSHGLVWGGLALACMIGLGVTGATQRQFVARWGFTRWRFIHFAMGILVVIFVLIHMTADGSHFAPIRDFLFGKDPSRVG